MNRGDNLQGANHLSGCYSRHSPHKQQPNEVQEQPEQTITSGQRSQRPSAKSQRERTGLSLAKSMQLPCLLICFSLMLEPSVQQALYLQNSYLDGHGRLKVPSGPEHEQPNDSAKIDGSKNVAPQPNVTSTTASSGDAATKAAMTSDPGQHKQRWDFFHRSK